MEQEEWSAIGLSVLVAAVATLGSLPFGIALGRLLARRQFFGKGLVETAISLPLVLPPVVTGYLLLIAFGRRGWIGRALYAAFGMEIVFTWKGAAIASAVMAFPLMVRSIRLAFSGVDPRLEAAARTLGAGRFETFFRVSLPLAQRGILAGAVLGFARSLGEFGATIMLAGNIPGQTQTIPLFVYSVVNSPGGEDRCLPLIVASVILAGLALACSEWLERRGYSPQSAAAK